MNFSLHGKTALITGASGGIGSSIAQAFLENGANVVLSGSNIEKLTNYAKNLDDRFQSQIALEACDLSDDESVKNLYESAEAKWGTIDILINNAGITKDKLVIMMKDDDFEKVLKVNLSAPFKLSKTAIKSMMKKNYGRIINITSVVGITGNAGQANYVASKAGLCGLTKSLALETATRGITINCVAPGFIDSAMTEKLNEKQKEHILSHIPQKRMGTGKDVAACCVFLASDEANYITGQTFHVNGGMFMGS